MPKEYVTTNEGSKTTNESLDEVNNGIDQSFANASITSLSSKCTICEMVFIGKVSSYNLRRHIGNVHGEDPDEYEISNNHVMNKALLRESQESNEFNLRSTIEKNHKTTVDEMVPETKELQVS